VFSQRGVASHKGMLLHRAPNVVEKSVCDAHLNIGEDQPGAHIEMLESNAS
jgi:hypothetical protein